MAILGIDYGLKKVGLALAASKIAEPLKVVRVISIEDAVRKVGQVAKAEKVEKVVVGVSESKMAVNSIEFAEALKGELAIPVELFDETLSTYEAQELSLKTGLKRKKRKEMEDAYSATIVLQRYLDVGR